MDMWIEQADEQTSWLPPVDKLAWAPTATVPRADAGELVAAKPPADACAELFQHYAEPAAPSREEEKGPGAYLSWTEQDVMEAMRHDRAFKPGMTPQEISDAMQRGDFKELLGDPLAAFMRARSRRELRSKLGVTNSGTAPNEVTEAEFENVVRMHADLRMGRGDLTMNTDGMSPEDAVRYRDAMMEDVGTLMQTRTGREEMQRLTSNAKHHHTTLTASLPQGAETTFKDKSDAEYDSKGRASDGSDATIHIDPGKSFHGCRSDVVLAHEMVHAVNGTEGTIDGSEVDATGDGTAVADPALPAQLAKLQGQLASLDPGDTFNRIMLQSEVNRLIKVVVRGSGDARTDDKGHRVKRGEHQAVGVGRWQGSQMSENSYRRERREVGNWGTGRDTGAKPGDATMPQRRSYSDEPDR